MKIFLLLKKTPLTYDTQDLIFLARFPEAFGFYLIGELLWRSAGGELVAFLDLNRRSSENFHKFGTASTGTSRASRMEAIEDSGRALTFSEPHGQQVTPWPLIGSCPVN
jgi:hypothetical protein